MPAPSVSFCMSAQTRVSQQSVQESTSHGAMTARRRGRRGRPRPRRRRGGDLDQEEKEGGEEAGAVSS